MTNNRIANILKDELAKRQRRNPAYSLRALADYLEVNSGTLSSIIQAKRSIPANLIFNWSEKLNFTPEVLNELINELPINAKKKLRRQGVQIEREKSSLLDDQLYYEVISEWEYYAFLNLIEVEKKDHSVDGLSTRLGISRRRMEVVIYKLLQLSLISEEGELYIRQKKKLKTTDDISSKALRKAHEEELDLAKSKLEEVDVLLREFTSSIVKFNPKNIDKAKKMLRTLRDEFCDEMESIEGPEVYQLSMQFFPLSNTKTNNIGEEYEN